MSATELSHLRETTAAQAVMIRELSERIATLECRFELLVEPRHQAYTSWQSEINSDRKKVWLAGWGVALSLAAVMVELARRFYLK